VWRRTRKLIAITQVAERLGVSVRYVRRLVHERRIPFIKLGHLVRFDPDEIDAWIERSRRPPRDDPSTDDGPRAA
jgi:excisionase family DNA binding protein